MTPNQLAELDDDIFRAFVRHMEREAKAAQPRR
jgi:hypothetical protein